MFMSLLLCIFLCIIDRVMKTCTKCASLIVNSNNNVITVCPKCGQLNVVTTKTK